MGSANRFSPLEKTFIENQSWFESIRILEANPELVDEGFARRLEDGAGATEDALQGELLADMARFVRLATEIGLEASAKEKIGEGGLLAGQAREARTRYYETGNGADLAEALDRFVLALAQEEDPMLFDQGRILQGFSATLLDLGEAAEQVEEAAVPAISFIGALGCLACITGALAVPPPFVFDDWRDRLARAAEGVRWHLERLERVTDANPAGEFCASVGRACASIERVLEEHPDDLEQIYATSHPAMCLALAATRIELSLPGANAKLTAETQATLTAWLAVVLGWIERYGSDFLRLSLASPVDQPFELLGDSASAAAEDGAMESEERSPASIADAPLENELVTSVTDQLTSAADLVLEEGEALRSGPSRPQIGELLGLALSTYAVAPERARKLAELIRDLLDADGDAALHADGATSDLESFLGSREALASLSAAVVALTAADQSGPQRFHRMREALPPQRLEEIMAVLEPVLVELQDKPIEPDPRTRTIARTALIVHDLTSALTVTAFDLGLPDTERYRATRDRLFALLFGKVVATSISLYGAFFVHPDAPNREEMAEAIGKFIDNPSALSESEADAVSAWLGAAYEAGHLTFPTPENEITALGNLGWLHLRAGRFETLKWSARSRRLALEHRALLDVATADINAASYFVDRVPPWKGEHDGAVACVGTLATGLAYAAEALRVTEAGWGLSEAGDRYFASSVGYRQVRELTETLLVKAKDPALLAEYLLNARGMWFLLDLYDQAASRKESRARPIVSWRKRSWVGQSLAVDEILEAITEAETEGVELSDVLAPEGEPIGLWFGNLLEEESGTVASALILPPRQFAGTFEEGAYDREAIDAMGCLDASVALGRLLPDPVWLVADALRETSERATLFASLDPGLPPLSMGLWRRDGDATVLADAFDVVYCPTVSPPAGTVPWIESGKSVTPAVFAICDPLGDLPEARTVPKLAREVCGNGRGMTAPPANRETVQAMIDACAAADGVLVYQGHSESGSLNDPEAAALLLEPLKPTKAAAERLGMGEVLRAVSGSPAARMPRRAAFLSCGSGLSERSHDATGIAMAALAGGSDAVLSTLRSVTDSGAWQETVDILVEALSSPAPWRAFGLWQQALAPTLANLPNEEARSDLASLAMFGTPFVRPSVTVGADRG